MKRNQTSEVPDGTDVVLVSATEERKDEECHVPLLTPESGIVTIPGPPAERDMDGNPGMAGLVPVPDLALERGQEGHAEEDGRRDHLLL